MVIPPIVFTDVLIELRSRYGGNRLAEMLHVDPVVGIYGLEFDRIPVGAAAMRTIIEAILVVVNKSIDASIRNFLKAPAELDGVDPAIFELASLALMEQWRMLVAKEKEADHG